MSESWYCLAFGQELGPMSTADLKVLVERGDVLSSDKIKCGINGAWQRAESRSEFFPASDALRKAPAAPAPAPQTAPVEAAQAQQQPPETLAAKLPAAESPAAESPAAGLALAMTAAAEPAPAEPAQLSAVGVVGRRGFKFFAAAGVLLALLGGVSGGLSALLWGDGGASRAVASSASGVDQQKMAALRGQIEELEKQHRELVEAAKPPIAPLAPAPQISPEPTPSAPDSAVPPAPPAAPAAPPAQAPEMPASPAGDKSPQPESQASHSEGSGGKQLDPLASSRAPSPGLPARQPPAPSSAPPASALASPPALAELTPEEVHERRRQRLDLLTQIYNDRADLLLQHAKVQTELNQVDAAIANAQNQLATAATAIAEFETLIATAQFNANASAAKITEWTTNIAELSAASVVIQGQIEQLNVKRGGVVEKLNSLQVQADQLRSRWLAVLDPFGSLDRGEEQEAMAAFNEWVRLQPDAPWAWLARGFANWQLGDHDAAFSDFNQAVNLKGPALSNSLAARGGLLHAMGRAKEALADFGKAIKLNKSDSMVYLFRARCNCVDAKYSAAKKDFETAIRLAPKDAESYRQYALLLAACPQDRFRNGKKAVANAEQACELTEWKNWSALDTLAAAHAEAGRFDDACGCAEKAAALTYGANRGQCLARLKQYKDGQPLRMDWKNQSGNPSAAADAPISK